MKKFRFEGRNTAGTVWYRAEADTIDELYETLEQKGVVGGGCKMPLDEAILEKYNKTWEAFNDGDGDLDFQKYQDWCLKNDCFLTDDEVLDVIKSQNGNAYYQTIEKWNGEEYEEV